MSYTMTHIIIAKRFAAVREIADEDLFLLGSIAPDAVHSRPDFRFELKSDSHRLEPRDMWGKIYTEEHMTHWYDLLKAFYEEEIALAQTPEEISFLQGYVLHCLVDIFNCKLLYGKNLIRYEFKVDAMREKYREECLKQDCYLYHNWSESRTVIERICSAGQRENLPRVLDKLNLAQYVSAQNIKDCVSYYANNYKSAPQESLDNLEMVSVESTEEFLDEVLEEALRILYDFPKAERTFRMN